MKKHAIIIMLIIGLLFIIPVFAYASPLTVSFGGKVLTTTVPDVDCYSSGTGPVVLFSNIMSVASATYSASGAGGKTNSVNRASGVVSGVYGAIPFYTLDESKSPQSNEWILGRANLVPSFDTCYLELGEIEIPFPVKTTNNYNISKNSL